MFEILAQSLLIATRTQTGPAPKPVDRQLQRHQQILRERQLRAEHLRVGRILQKG